MPLLLPRMPELLSLKGSIGKRQTACDMPQAKTGVELQFSESCAAEVALQHSLFLQCRGHLHQKLRCNNRKIALQHCKKMGFKKAALSCCFLRMSAEFPNLVVSDLVVCNFYAEALFCALLHSFALFFCVCCALLQTCVCALLCSFELPCVHFACFCVRPRLE